MSYMDQYKDLPTLTREEEVELVLKIRLGGAEGEAAREKFIRHNIKLVAMLAHRVKKPKGTLEDLIQEGTLGVMRALEDFDPERKVRFSTYASWWIRCMFNNYIRDARVIQISASRYEQLRIIQKAARKLRKGLADPSVEELATYTGFPLETVQAVRDIPMVIGQDIRRFMDDEEHYPNVSDSDALSAVDVMVAAELEDRLGDLLQGLPDREQQIFRLLSEKNLSYSEIGKEVGLSRERVRQLFNKYKPVVAARAKALGLV